VTKNYARVDTRNCYYAELIFTQSILLALPL